MLVDKFNEVHDNFKLNFYNHIFKGFEDREASLTTTEVFCVEAINALEKPTVTEISDFMDVSKQNMSYRLSQLEEKGYIKKTQSQSDKREYFLEVTDKFKDYYKVRHDYITKVFKRVEERYSKEEIGFLEEILTVIARDLMPEVNSFKDNLRFKNE